MRVMAQMAMVMNLDKCIGCHTCSVTCKQAWTNRAGTEYVWFNNVETRPGQGYPRGYEDQEKWKGGWKLNSRGRLALPVVAVGCRLIAGLVHGGVRVQDGALPHPLRRDREDAGVGGNDGDSEVAVAAERAGSNRDGRAAQRSEEHTSAL